MSRIFTFSRITQLLSTFYTQQKNPFATYNMPSSDVSLKHLVRGTIMFEAPNDKPMHHVTVLLFSDEHDDPIGRGDTDMEGKFEITYDPSGGYPLDLRIEVCHHEVRYASNGVMRPRLKPLVNAEVPEALSVNVKDHDFGTLFLPCWQRAERAKSFTPRLVVDAEHVLPQQQRAGRLRAGRYVKFNTFLGFNPLVEVFGRITKNKTMEMRDDKRSLMPESDDYHVELALNGFNPKLMKRQSENVFYMDFSYKGIGLDGIHVAPDSTAYFTKCEEGYLNLTSIELRRRKEDHLTSPFAEYGDAHTFKHDMEGEDGRDLWDRVKRIWRCNYFFFGEVNTHLTETHLNVEQYIIPIMRNVRRSPLFTILAPHFYGTVDINHKADQILTGGKGLVVSTSAVTSYSVADVVHNHFKTLNWHGWTPREPLAKNHTFAHLQKLFWTVITEYVDTFFEENQEAIEANWIEIKLMSDELVDNAKEYDDTIEDEPWQDKNELNKRDSPRVTRRGRIVTVSPVTNDEKITDGNRAENIENLKQFCRYLIHHTTLRHTYINDRQFDLGGDPDFASLGLERDMTDLTVDAELGITKSLEDIHRQTTYALSSVKYGLLMKDEDNDINPVLKELLQKNEATFSKLGQDIDDIRSCINI